MFFFRNPLRTVQNGKEYASSPIREEENDKYIQVLYEASMQYFSHTDCKKY